MNIPSLSYVALVAAFLLALPAQAQQFTGALKIGGAVTSLSSDAQPERDFDPRSSLTGGVAFGYDFGNGFLFQPEVLYTIKGAYGDAESNNVPARIKFDLTYLEFPLIVVYRFERPRGIKPKFFAGPWVAYNLDARVRIRAKGSDLVQTEEDVSAESLDYGALIGVGVDFSISAQQMSFDIRGLLGQRDIGMDELLRREDGSKPELTNTGVAFFLGVVF